jgi:hypothetical protein
MHTVVTVSAPASAPVACTLSANDYQQRTRQLAELAGSRLRSRTRIAGGQRLAFQGAPGLEGRLRDAVAAEASCCAFLTMTLYASEDGTELVLDVTGPADAQAMIAELFA